MNALVISGGGSRGAFAVGAIEVLREAGIGFELVAGTSTGALIGPLVITDEIQLLRSIYTSVRTEDVIRQRHVLEILLEDAIYDSGPLWRLINSFITPARYAELIAAQAELFLTTVNLQSGELVYWNQHGGGPAGGPLSRRTLMRAMLASASMPVLMPPVRIYPDGDQHVDGGVREIAPLSVAIAHGATDLYAIVLSPIEHGRTDETYIFLIETLVRTINLFTREVTFNDVQRAQLYNRAVEYQHAVREKAEALLSPEQVEEIFEEVDAPNPFAEAHILNLHLIRPEHELPASALEFEPLVMAQMMERGREAARRTLDRGPLQPAIA